MKVVYSVHYLLSTSVREPLRGSVLFIVLNSRGEISYGDMHASRGSLLRITALIPPPPPPTFKNGVLLVELQGPWQSLLSLAC